MRKMFLTLALAAVVGGSALAQSAKPDEEKIVARVNGEVITAALLDYMWSSLPADARLNYEGAGGKVGFLDNYIERRLVLQQAVKEKFDKREDVQYEVARARERVLINMYIEKIVAADVFPEAELRKYYDENRREFAQPEKAKVRHIVVTPIAMPVYNSANDDAVDDASARKKIEMIHKLVLSPKAKFDDIASKYSEDLSAKSGGDLGWMPRGRMSNALDEALFTMKPGETSGVIATEFGYHVIRCEGREPAGFLSFEEAKQPIIDILMKDRQAEVIAAGTALTQELRPASAITIYRENL